jgi:hypothetical protein
MTAPAFRGIETRAGALGNYNPGQIGGAIFRAPSGLLKKGIPRKSIRKTTSRKKATVSKTPSKRVKKTKA